MYSFPFNVISVATVLCFCGFHPPVVSTLPWFPPSHGFHLSMVSTLCGYSVVCTLLLFASSHGYSWCPFCGLHFRGLHSAVVSTLPWFASSCCSHPPCGYSVVSLPWFALSWFTLCCGFHPPVVCIFMLFPPSLWLLRGVPSMVCTFMVYTLLWFPPSRGLHLCVLPTLPVVTPWVSLSWFAPSCGLHSAMVSTLSWLLRGVHPGFWLKLA